MADQRLSVEDVRRMKIIAVAVGLMVGTITAIETTIDALENLCACTFS